MTGRKMASWEMAAKEMTAGRMKRTREAPAELNTVRKKKSR